MAENPRRIIERSRKIDGRIFTVRYFEGDPPRFLCCIVCMHKLNNESEEKSLILRETKMRVGRELMELFAPGKKVPTTPANMTKAIEQYELPMEANPDFKKAFEDWDWQVFELQMAKSLKREDVQAGKVCFLCQGTTIR